MNLSQILPKPGTVRVKRVVPDVFPSLSVLKSCKAVVEMPLGLGQFAARLKSLRPRHYLVNYCVSRSHLLLGYAKQNTSALWSFPIAIILTRSGAVLGVVLTNPDIFRQNPTQNQIPSLYDIRQQK
jgi:hypothetical protein